MQICTFSNKWLTEPLPRISGINRCWHQLLKDPVALPVRGTSKMPNHYSGRREGPIRGLRLPLAAWNSLQDEGIRTLDELRASADRLERLPGIGAKTAQV